MTLTDRERPADGDKWPDVLDVEPPERASIAAVVVAALGTDLAIRSRLDGLAGALLVLAVAAGLVGSGRVTNRRAWPVIAAAPALGFWLVARSSEWLLFLDVVAACSVLVIGASFSRRGDPFDLTVPDLIGRALHALAHGVLAIGFVAGAFGRRDGRAAGRAAAIVRGVLLAMPVVVILVALLGSADPVFASFVRIPDLSDLIGHLVLLTVGGWGAAGLLRLASGEPYDVHLRGRRPLGPVEAATVLGGLVVVFAGFAVSQFVAVVGGADYVRRTAGLSYAEYARNGFFQLLAVAAITLGVLLAVRATVADVRDRRFVLLSEAAVVLTLVVVIGAVRRLTLYEEAYGLTTLRLISLLFAAWIGGVFVLLGVALTGRVRQDTAWFLPASLVLAVVMLLAIDVANPEATIVRRNVDRFAGTDELDVEHLLGLSDDAVPALLDAVPRMRSDQAARVLDAECRGERRPTGGLWAFNLSHRAAVDARNRTCPAADRR